MGPLIKVGILGPCLDPRKWEVEKKSIWIGVISKIVSAEGLIRGTGSAYDMMPD